MKNILLLMLFFVVSIAQAQKIKTLDSNRYTTNFEKSPFVKVQVFEKNSQNESDLKLAKLKKGRYKLQLKEGLLEFQLNKKQIIKQGTLKVIKEDGKYVGEIRIKDSKIQSVNIFWGKRKMEASLNHQDSILIRTDYFIGEIKQKTTEFYKNDQRDYVITKDYYEDGSYSIFNEAENTRKYYNAKGEPVNPKDKLQSQEGDVANAENIVEAAADNKYKIYPFRYQKKWGLIDANKSIVQEPEYDDIIITYDYQFLVFVKGKESVVYNTKIGEKNTGYGEYIDQLMINPTYADTEDDNKYLMFNKNEKSYLINLTNDDKIQLYDKYHNVEKVKLFNEKGEKTYDFFILSSDKGKKLMSSYYGAEDTNEFEEISKKYFNEFEIISDIKSKALGLVAIDGQSQIFVYDSSFKLLTSFKRKNKDYFTYEEDAKISGLFKSKVYLSPEDILEMAKDDGVYEDDLKIKLPKQFQFDENQLFFISRSDKKIRVNTHTYQGDYLEFIRFGENSVMVDEDYIPFGVFLFPDKYFENY